MADARGTSGSPGRLALAALVLGPVLATGCTVTPLMHPLRAHDGLFADYAWSAGTLAELPKDEDGRCQPALETGGGVFTPVQLSGGYGHVFLDHLGVMGGLYLPAWGNQQGDLGFATVLGAYGYVTFQDEHWAVGVGPEVGARGAGLTAGAEAQPWGPGNWLPRFGGYGRWYWPYETDGFDINGRSRTWEVGGRLGLGAVHVQYSYHRRRDSLIGLEPLSYGSSSRYGRAMHLVTIGGSLSGYTLGLKRPPLWATVLLAILVAPVGITALGLRGAAR